MVDQKPFRKMSEAEKEDVREQIRLYWKRYSVLKNGGILKKYDANTRPHLLIGVSGRCELVLDEQCQHKQPGCECHGKHRSAPSQEIDAARCTARTPEARMAALGSISLVLLGAEPHVTISPRHGPMLVGAVAGWLPLYLLVRRVPVGDRVAPRRHVSSSGGGVQASTLAGTSCVAPESTPYSRRLGAKLRGSCGISQSREERGCVLRSAAYSSTPRAGVHRCA